MTEPRGTHRIAPTIVALLGFALTIAAFYPGWMSADSVEQLREGRTGEFSDWHPPTMAFVWGWVDRVIAGPLGMLALHAAMFWTGLRWFVGASLPDRPGWVVALVVAGIGLWPGSFALLGTVWKDIGMAAAILLGVAGIADAARSQRRWPLAVTLLAFCYAMALRHNAMIAIAPLMLAWAQAACANLQILAALARSRLRVAALATVGFVVLLLVATTCNRSLAPRSWHPVQQLLLHDLVAISIATDEVLLPERLRVGEEAWTVEALRPLYWPTVAPLYWGPPPRLPRLADPEFVAELRSLWLEHVPRNLVTYSDHRWQIFKIQLGLDGDLELPFHPRIDPNPWGYAVADTWLARTVLAALTRVSQSHFFRAWTYVVALLGLLVFGCFRKGPGRPLANALAGSGLGYLLVGFFVSPVPDFRFNHWGVVATLLAVTATLSPAARQSPPEGSTEVQG